MVTIGNTEYCVASLLEYHILYIKTLFFLLFKIVKSHLPVCWRPYRPLCGSSVASWKLSSDKNRK